jgi:nicotinate-nucleotide adenylyltransferase
MRLGYFGGSFDPPHDGHLAVAQAAAAAFQLDQVLLVPTSHQPLKPNGPVAGYADRLAMLRLLCAQAPTTAALIASDLEAPLPDGGPHYTIDTLRRLRTTLAPVDKLFVLVGADAFLQLPLWRAPEELLSTAEWIIVSRPGFDLQRLQAMPLYAAHRGRVHLLPTLENPTSATALRRALAAGIDPEAAGLPPSIAAYIRAHHLYGSTA